MYLTKESLRSNEKARFILIKEDASNLFGMKIFKTLIKMFCKEAANIVIANYDSSKEDISYGLDTSNINLEYMEEFGAHLSTEWVKNTLSIDILEERILSFEGVVFIDSLTSLLIHNGVEKVYKTLYKLLNTNTKLQIVALVCPDVHDSYENDLLDRLSTTTLQVSSDTKLQSIVHYGSGKVSCLQLEYQISAAFEFTSLVDAKFVLKKSPSQQPDPTANLTFNLRLKDEEVKAKNELQLPYMKTSDEAIVQSLIDNDLYDEEDPDDDLDI
ncbi:hypothetical protein JTE90_006491 [Oedothorax gibbosus]|uniref:Elongator complex protein 5 n=1 Tax=Oedothorax gibbosus TaxID=931172 RepID=A0AAV6VPX6_9ARAC|nr:hypothetical protein JTE90_006491 [Oedothorax gibbosus]